MSGKGYIKIDRKIDGWEYRHDMSRLGFWLHLLLSAEWKGPERGTFITSIRELEQDTCLHHRTITRFLDELESLQQIRREPAGKMTKITILKYKNYQSGPWPKCHDTVAEMPQSDVEPWPKCHDTVAEMPQSDVEPWPKCHSPKATHLYLIETKKK